MNRVAPIVLLFATAAYSHAHPMGNFSVNHYSHLSVTATGVQLEYVLDLAEIPTLELLHTWNLDRSSDRSELENKASAQARIWLSGLKITAGGEPISARFQSSDLFIGDGAANLPILRVTAHALIEASPGELTYEDLNYPDRAGWKEIVISRTGAVTLERASQSDQDISKALTQYPADPTLAPPQDLRATLAWTTSQPKPTVPHTQQIPEPITEISPVPQPHSAPAAVSPAAMTAQTAPPGTVVRGDFLSRVLHRSELPAWMILLALGAAFGLGALHALTPGHGKTIVAAYLVGSRGTLRHAAFLGAMVTFTHTISVFILGIATLFLFQYVVPEKIVQALGVISGLSIVAVGCWMAYKRLQSRARVHHHHHDHDHHHEHQHVHAHNHPHDHHHDHHEHSHQHPHTHSHGSHTHTHSHMPEELSWSGLVALGVSGGLVPCESALVLMLSAIALGRAGLGLLLLLSFSLGLALVLMAIGAIVLYSKNWISQSAAIRNKSAFQWLPIASAAVVVVVGLLMTGVSAGLIQSRWLV